jgi:hypothetical protein
MIYIIIILLILFLITLSTTIFFFLCTKKLLGLLEETKEILEKKIEKSDLYYVKLSQILELDLFSDDPYIKEFITLLSDFRNDLVETNEKLFQIGEKDNNDL